MAISVDPLTYIISVPKADLTLVQSSPEIRELNLNDFRFWLKDWEDEPEGMVQTKTNDHNTEVVLSGLTYARIITVLSPYTVEFEDGQYSINCVGANHNLADVKVVNQVSLIVNNAAGLVSSPDIEYASFQSGVWIDAVNGDDSYKGNEQWPVKTVERALVVKEYRGFRKVYLLSDITFGAGHDIRDMEIIGQSHVHTDLHVEDAAVCDRVKISNVSFTGILDGDTEITDSLVGDCIYFNGHIHDCGLNGTIVLGGGKKALIANCRTVDQDLPPTIDMGGTGQSLSMPNYSGVITVSNLSDATQEIGIGMDAGLLTLDSTITAGTIILAGIGILIDNSLGTASINTDGLMNKELIASVDWEEVHYDNVLGTSGTVFPQGTASAPVDNLTDALAIANTHKISKLSLGSSLTLDQNVQGFTLFGSPGVILDPAGFSIYGCVLEELRLTGNLGPHQFFARTCSLTTITGLLGSYDNCWFLDTTPITVASNENVLMVRCASSVPGSDSPILDFSNGDILFNMRSYSGGIRIVNSDDPNNISTFEFVAGKFNFDATTNTAGEFQIRGVVDREGIDFTTTANLFYTGSVGTDIEQEYNNVVYLDPVNGHDGVSYPTGLTNDAGAANSLASALAIANLYHCSIIHLEGDMTIDGEDITGFTIRASRSLGNSVSVVSMLNSSTCYFQDVTVSGALAGGSRFTNCVLGDLTGFDGGAKDSLLTDDIEVVGDGANYLTNCDTYVTDTTYKSISIGSKLLNIIRCRGSFEIADYTGTAALALDFSAGNVLVASGCVSGTIVVSGPVHLEDQSGAGCYVVNATLTESGIVDKTWDEPIADHLTGGTFGGELSLKSDVISTSVTSETYATSGSVIYGTNIAGDYTNLVSKDDSYWQVQEDGTDGLTLEIIYNIPDNDKAGIFSVFGRYEGVPGTSHFMELFIWNYESSAFEQLIEEFMPGGNVSDSTHEHEYYERHIDRTNNNEVKIRLVHHVTTYNASHNLYLDYAELTSVEIITAAILADAVWDEPIADHLSVGSTGSKLNVASSGGVDYTALADAVWDASIDDHLDEGSTGNKLNSGGSTDPIVKLSALTNL